MEASLYSYPAGAIVRYQSPLSKAGSQKIGIPESHPVLIVGNSTVPETRCQCMVISSQIDRYVGYRIHLNTTDQRYNGMSVICTTAIHTIKRFSLHEIIGFVSPTFLDKCRKAYAFEIGLTDVIPEYYRDCELFRNWIDAGEPNIPTNSIAHERIAAYNPGYNVATEDFPHRWDGTIQNITVQSMGVSEAGAIGYKLPQVPPVPPLPELQKGSEAPKPESEKTPEPPPTEAPAKPKKKWGAMCQDIMDLIEECKPEPIKRNDIVAEAYKKLNYDDCYEIWCRRIGPTELVKRGVVTSVYYGDLLIKHTMWRLAQNREKIVAGVLDKSVDLNFISEGYAQGFRIFRTRDLKDVRMGMRTYDRIAQKYDFGVKNYLQEIRDAGLLKITSA